MPIEIEIRKFIEENFILKGEDNLGDEDSLLEKGIIDSTGILEMVAFIEEMYGIRFSDDELLPENLDSIMNISKYIVRKMESKTRLIETHDAILQKVGR